PGPRRSTRPVDERSSTPSAPAMWPCGIGIRRSSCCSPSRLPSGRHGREPSSRGPASAAELLSALMQHSCQSWVFALALALASGCAGDPGSPKSGGNGTASSESVLAASTTEADTDETRTMPRFDTPAGDSNSDADEPPECNPGAFVHAPAAVEIDGLSAV